jgi:hypothetical protein
MIPEARKYEKKNQEVWISQRPKDLGLWCGHGLQEDVYRATDVDLTPGVGPNGEPPYMMDWNARPELDPSDEPRMEELSSAPPSTHNSDEPA